MKLLSKLWRTIVPDLLVQRKIGDTVFTLSLRDHPSYWLTFKEHPVIPFPKGGVVWDLGCSIGYYSVAAALNNCTVFSFDISLTNILCLRQTAYLSHLENIRAIHSPVTVGKTKWSPATTGGLGEKLCKNGSLDSIDFQEAAKLFGMPNFIKMDIEGSEREFLSSPSFKDWIITNRIGLYVELHGIEPSLPWKEFVEVGPYRLQLATS
jgi:FkbM family methyltransferase